MRPSPKRSYRTPPRLAERPEGALTFAEIASLRSFRGISTSTLRNWLADGALGRLPAPDRGRGVAVYDAAHVAGLVARGRPRPRAREAAKPRRRARAGVAEVGYGVDDGWATAVELARTHGLPQSSSLVLAVARWNQATAGQRGVAEALGAELGVEHPDLAAMLPIEARVRIVAGRRCRTYRAAHVALVVARGWQPSGWTPWAKWASACVQAHLPDQASKELIRALADEAQSLAWAARREATRSTEPLGARLERLVRGWCGAGADASRRARLDERYAQATASSLRGKALRDWGVRASQRPLSIRDELVALHLLGAPQPRALVESGLGGRLARLAVMDLASDKSPTRGRWAWWAEFVADLGRVPARKGHADSERALALVFYARAVAGSLGFFRERVLPEIVEALGARIASASVSQCVAFLRALQSKPELDEVAHHALGAVHERSSRSAMLAKRVAGLANEALRAGRGELLHAVVSSSSGSLRADRWLGAIAVRTWRSKGAPTWLLEAVRDCVVRGKAPLAEEAVLRSIDGSRGKKSATWALVAARLARAVLAASLGPDPRDRRWRDPLAIEGDWRAVSGLLRQALGRRASPRGRDRAALSIAVCLELAEESTGPSASELCHAATRAASTLLGIADESIGLDVIAALARSPALDPYVREIIAALGRLAGPATRARARLFALGEQAQREGRAALVHWIALAFFSFDDLPEIPSAWLECAVRDARSLGPGQTSTLLTAGLSDPRLGTEWAVTLLLEDPAMLEDATPEVRPQLAELSEQIPDFAQQLEMALAAREKKEKGKRKARAKQRR